MHSYIVARSATRSRSAISRSARRRSRRPRRWPSSEGASGAKSENYAWIAVRGVQPELAPALLRATALGGGDGAAPHRL